MFRAIDNLGDLALSRLGYAFRIASMLGSVMSLSMQPRFWPRTTRDIFARQILFTGIEALGFICILGLLIGTTLVAQTQYWLSRTGFDDLLGPVLATALIQQFGPFVVNVVVIARSGTAMAAEIANMKVRHEIDLLDQQGVDPFSYLVLPRVLGAGLSVSCLACVFILIALGSGYITSLLMGASTGSPSDFLGQVLNEITPMDFIALVAKTLIPGLLMGSICCMQGFLVKPMITDVPRAVTRAVVQSITALFVVMALVTLVTMLVKQL
jgi:phospholipid/cholesterol/gamma-HCH transport system permease protein